MPRATRAGESLRIAYFISSYGPGEQLFRLASILRTAEPDSPIVVHHDRFSGFELDPVRVRELGIQLLTSDHPIVWGDMTLEAARWRVFRWIRENLDVDWVMLLSEQDYPIAPLAALRTRIAESGADAIIEATRVDDADDPTRRKEYELRYYYQYFTLPQLGVDRVLPRGLQRITDRLRRILFGAVARVQRKVRFYAVPSDLGLPSRIGFRQRETPFSPAFPCWKNECWFAISGSAIDRVLQFIDSNPDYVRYFERTVIPLESATATILFNDPGTTVENAPLHAIRWRDNDAARPESLGLHDLAFLDSSRAVFARKFDRGSEAVLDALDARVLPAERGTA